MLFTGLILSSLIAVSNRSVQDRNGQDSSSKAGGLDVGLSSSVMEAHTVFLKEFQAAAPSKQLVLKKDSCQVLRSVFFKNEQKKVAEDMAALDKWCILDIDHGRVGFPDKFLSPYMLPGELERSCHNWVLEYIVKGSSVYKKGEAFFAPTVFGKRVWFVRSVLNKAGESLVGYQSMLPGEVNFLIIANDGSHCAFADRGASMINGANPPTQVFMITPAGAQTSGRNSIFVAVVRGALGCFRRGRATDSVRIFREYVVLVRCSPETCRSVRHL